MKKHLYTAFIVIAAVFSCTGLAFVTYQLFLQGWKWVLIFLSIGIFVLIALVYAMKEHDKNKRE